MSKIDLIIGALIGFNVMAHEQKIPVYIEESNKALAAARELKEEKQELVEALQEMVSQFDQFGLIDCEERAIKDARAILAKHKEQA